MRPNSGRGGIFYGFGQQGTKEQRAQLRALQKQEMELLKSLFGPDLQAQMMKDSGGLTGWKSKYGFIPRAAGAGAGH